MTLTTLLIETVLISLSGVMAPGPITAATVGKGSESPHAGAWVAVGHGLVEFPLIAAVFYGLGRFLDYPYVKRAIAFAGAVLLLVTAVGILRSIKRVETKPGTYARGPVLVGALLSLGNPFFLIWWATVGAALIIRSARFGVMGLVAFSVLHWLCDFSWCYALSALSFRGGRSFGARFQQSILVVCGLSLLAFSGKFAYDAVADLFV